MKRARAWSRRSQAVVYTAAAAVALALLHAILNIGNISVGGWGVAIVYAVTIVVGELWRVNVLGTRDFTPIALAASLAMPMTTSLPGNPETGYSAGFVVVVVALATFVGHLVRRWMSVGAFVLDQIASRVLVVTVAAILFLEVPLDGRPLAVLVHEWHDMMWMAALAMLAVALVAMGLQLLLMAMRHSVSTHALLWQSLVDEVGAVGPLALATTSSATVIALAVGALGQVAIPLFLAPLLLLQLAVSRQSLVRDAQRQTIRSLSRLTDQGGFTTVGHGDRVATLSLAIGRDLGLAERDLVDLEYSALLHDLGQVSLRRPIPGGATTAISPLDQRRIAHTGASILARTAELSRLSMVVSGQATPYRHGREAQDLALACRILKVSNAFDDLTGGHVKRPAAAQALERIRLNLGYEYDPLVVRSLCRVLVRDGRVTPAEVVELDV
ncbi:metal-dependent phosphohydrolase [Ornithinimicrobium sp. F0845]|uniref:HD-GYP domain-containing protein n=1 Tax=Ornithinimicrobium sp. F0845 TaxID=2926412 RepID=UPI001FF6110E|nr:HD domain-containing phosphohydrolase [Ornithinimicrobium sp. F0845]MCK0111128.1 metal-dependent phosphohydrolase [Ornithinimicrobium sp. F0845]